MQFHQKYNAHIEVLCEQQGQPCGNPDIEFLHTALPWYSWVCTPKLSWKIRCRAHNGNNCIQSENKENSATSSSIFAQETTNYSQLVAAHALLLCLPTVKMSWPVKLLGECTNTRQVASSFELNQWQRLQSAMKGGRYCFSVTHPQGINGTRVLFKYVLNICWLCFLSKFL